MERKEQRLLIGLDIGVTLLWVFMVKFWIFYPSTLFTLLYLWFLVWVAVRRPNWLPALLAVAIPLEVSKEFIPAFSLPEQVAGYNVSYLDFFRLAQIALALRWLTDFWYMRKKNIFKSFYNYIKKDSLLWLPIVLLGVYLLSTLFSVAPRSSIGECLRLVTLLATFYMTLPYLKEPDDLRRVVYVLIAVGVILNAIAIVEYFTGYFFFSATPAVVISKRANATFADPNMLARFLVVTIIFAMAELERQRTWRGRVVALGAILLQGAGLGITGSRSGLLAFAVAGLVFAILVPKRRFTLSALVLMIIGIMAVALKNPVFMARLASLSHLLTAMGDSREYLARMGIAMLRDHLLLGVGIGAYGPAFTKLYAYFNPYSTFYVSLPHTAVITVLAETGFVGFIVLYLLFAKTLQRGWEILLSHMENLPIKFISASTVAGVMAIFISAQGEGRLYEDPLLWVLWAVLISATRLRVK